MKTFLYCLFFLLAPLSAFTQITAPGADKSVPTTGLSGKLENVYVFFDDKPIELFAASAATSDFTWKKLDINNIDLVTVLQQTGVTSSELNASSFGGVVTEGGYMVEVYDAVAMKTDTFYTWAFTDNFKIDSITYGIDCDALVLTMHTTPSIYASYTIYNFKQFLEPPHVGETIFRGIEDVLWTPSTDIHAGVADADESWSTNRNNSTVIDAPPPLFDASYTLRVTDVFGKTDEFTTPQTISAISAYAKARVEEDDNGSWMDAGNEPKGEALFRVRFSHKESISADKFIWKGFADANIPNGDKTLVWADSTELLNDYVSPQIPYKNQLLDGYIPGKYKVRLTVLNTTTGCADSTEIKYIEVDPSSFEADAIPNVFTPNGDGQNDYFTFVTGKEPVSLEYINIYIYNRSGGLVYRYEGRIDAWKGWDGRRMGTGSDVADGVYYYVINGGGWDGIVYNNSEYKGYFHIFR
jgi:gliding motility-associated-like protein